jgi:ABC-2 type transport system ATP-binding protein
MASAISVRKVQKTFGDHKAVDDLSFEVPEGIVFGLLGPNGAGKSTTIRMVMDIIRPDSGEILVLGEKPSSKVKGQIGFLPEERGLYRKMKVVEVLEFQGSIKGARPAEARREGIAWLDRLGLADWKDKKVEELSKGMQQKAQIAAAMLGKPRLLILDEPFAGMDPVNQNVFKDLLLELNRSGVSIVFSTHQMDTAEKICHAIVLIHRGAVVLEGSLGEVKGRFGRNSVALEVDGDVSFLRALPGVLHLDDYGNSVELRLAPGTEPQTVLRAAVDRVRVRRFEVVAPTLHTIFLEQVGDAAQVKVLREEASHA